MKYLLGLLGLIFCHLVIGQIVTVDPAFFDVDNTITITFDASQGNAGLLDENQVYAHTGVITTSGGAGNWQQVQGNWGTDDAKVKMTNIGNNLHQLSFVIRDFYGLGGGNLDIVQLAFVFRNVNGSKEGKTSSGGDIFVSIPVGNAFDAFFQSPIERQIIVERDNSIFIEVVASKESQFIIYDNDIKIAEGVNTKLALDYKPQVSGDHMIRFEAIAGSEKKVGIFSFVYDPQIEIVDPPAGVELGLQYNSDYSKATILLFAPEKQHVFLLNNLNDFMVSQDWLMNRSIDGSSWWMELDTESENEYLYQLLVDGTIKIADPLSELILDPMNDNEVVGITTLPAYPREFTDGHLTYTKAAPKSATPNEFEPPKEEDLVIYELLLRDFLESHNYKDLRDTLSYLKKMGINAIELMPIQEFEGNDSWGYNPSYHMALDKYYGGPDEFQAFVNEAHDLGIAIIIDVVYNHAFGQSPLVRLYWDAANNRPAQNSPYFNVTPKHPFNVGFDFNHESNATREYVKRSLKYWIEEYGIDGYRFDLSKGFTQNFSANNDQMSAYDQSRINILTDYAEFVWSIDPEQYVILEHFASNEEEQVLAEKGMMLWGNGNFNFNEATMGYHDDGKSNFAWQSYKERNWNQPNVVGYMESHDEERLMYKNLQFGNRSGSYNVQELNTALKRNEMAAIFFFSIPGPKMMWQFGELGYDFSINRCVNGIVGDCRLDRKPIRWDYQNNESRQELSEVYRQMINLKVNNDIFRTRDFSLDVSSPLKTIHLNSSDRNAVVIGNFDVISRTASVDFQKNGTWYDYFSNDSIVVSNNTASLQLDPGTYHLYLDSKSNLITATNELSQFGLETLIYPNPSQGRITLELNSVNKFNASIEVIDIQGKSLYQEGNVGIKIGAEKREIDLQHLQVGQYFLKLQTKEGRTILPFVIVN